MGYEQVPNSRNTAIRDLWGGWYPQKTHGDIPGSMFEPGPIGATDCSNSIWLDGALRKIFGFAKVNTAALNGGAEINSLFYSQNMADVFGNAGTQLYKGLDTAVPTNITNAVTISATALLDWTEWQFEGVKYAIGTDGINPVFKHDGATTTLLANAPIADYVLRWQNVIWAAKDEKLSFSNLGDPEIWDVDDNYIFDANIHGIGRLGTTFVVFFEDHIGVLNGENNRLLTNVTHFIDGIGCSGKQTIRSAKLNNQDVLVFHAANGFYAFDGSQNITRLSSPIDAKYQDADSNDHWNETRFGKAWAAFDYRFNWYVCGLSDGGQATNATAIYLDCQRPFQEREGLSVPHWPMKNVQPMNCVEFSRNQTKLGDLLFGSNNGFVYKFDSNLYNRDGVGYTSFYKSKIFDMINSSIVAEFNILSKVQGANSVVTAYINTSLEEGDGLSATTNFVNSSDILDSTFIIGSSILGGRSFILRNVGTTGFGRYFQFKVENTKLDQQMVIHSIDLILQGIGVETNVGN